MKVNWLHVVIQEEEEDIKEIAPNTYEANAMMRIDEIAEFFNMDEKTFDDEDVDTIGGLVLKELGRIAEVNDSAALNGLTFIVKEIDGARITKLIIKREQPPEEEKEETQDNN